MTELDSTSGIAEPAGVDDRGRRLFRLKGQLLNEDELQAHVEKLYASEAEDVELDRELGLVNRRTLSYDPKTLDFLRTLKAIDDEAEAVDGETAASVKLHLRAVEILEAQGKAGNYSADEYIAAVEEAAA
jgi:hypothetical protein